MNVDFSKRETMGFPHMLGYPRVNMDGFFGH